MATDLKQKYGTEAQGITITLASLANSGQRQSTVVDNTSLLFREILVQLKLKSGASSVSATGYVNIYAFGTVDIAGGLYADGAGAADAAITLTAPPNMRLIGVLNMVANATSYVSEPMSLAAAFGGVVPEKWGIVIENKTGAALDSSEGNHIKEYQGILDQSV